MSRLVITLTVLVFLGGPSQAADRRPPNVVLLVVDTLRFDHLSLFGYPAPITPNVDRLLEHGVAFTQARVPEPLTAPSMISMLTSLHPHEHGATRNGMTMRPSLPSLTSLLTRRGYRTAAFIGNWTLRDKLTGLAEHFEDYREVLTRRRWLGFRTREANARDLNEEALGWVEEHVASSPSRPFLLWIHYVEPHAPYRLHEKQAARLKISLTGAVSNRDRYATEVAYVDDAIGDFLTQLDKLSPAEQTLIVFFSDHGESLGEHGEWGHGRDLYESCLHVPMGLAWAGQLAPRKIAAAASSLDLTPTLLGLLGSPAPLALRGFDWSPVLRGEAAVPASRATFHQAHKGAVHSGGAEARRKGLLEVGRVIDGKTKEVWRLKSKVHRLLFDFAKDPAEVENQAKPGTKASAELETWLEAVQEGLAASDALPPPSLDEESLEQLRALGYLE